MESLLEEHPRFLIALSREDIERFSALFQNRSFVLKWFSSGLPFPGFRDDAILPNQLQNDKEIFLLLSEHGCTDDHTFIGIFCHNSFGEWCPANLLSDKNFLLQVVKHSPALLKFAPAHLQQDFDLALLAFSGKRDQVDRYFISGMAATLSVLRHTMAEKSL